MSKECFNTYSDKIKTSEIPCFSSDLKDINKDVLESNYGFKIVLDSDYDMWSTYNIAFLSEAESKQVLYKFYRDILSIYPNWFIKSWYIKEIYLFKSIKDQKWNDVGGFTLNGRIFLSIYWNNLYQFHHELFHRFDNNDGNGDDDEWKKRFWWNEKVAKDFSPEMYEKVVWYADKYAMTQWTDEDQATTLEYLLIPSKKKDFLLRLKKDEVLRKKVMVITWAFFDTNIWKFTRNLSEPEYKELSWLSGYEYYFKWSKWKINFNFWNIYLQKNLKI